MTESQPPAQEQSIDATTSRLPGVTYPEKGQWPVERFSKYDELKAEFPWADAVRDELKLLYQRQRVLRPDIRQPSTNITEHDLLDARVEGTLQALRLLGLTAINGQAKDEIER